MLPGFSDVSMVLHAGRSNYDRLLNAGVRIFERRDALLHAKTVAIDGVWRAQKLALQAGRGTYPLADGLPADPAVDGEAGSFDWRTAPLIGTVTWWCCCRRALDPVQSANAAVTGA